MTWPAAMGALRDTLATLYYREADIARMVASAGLDPGRVAFDLKAVNTWQAILQEAEDRGRTDTLIEAALRDYAQHAALLEAVQNYRQWVAAGRPDEGFGAAVRERLPEEPETVFIPAGPFLMGSVAGPGVAAIETPQHEVSLRAYRIGVAPVTNAQYLAYVQQGGEGVAPEAGWVLAEVGQAPVPGTEQHPMVGLSWDEAAAYCRWLSDRTGRAYHLPSEAEWEKGARGADGRLYPWGNEFAPSGDEFAPQRCNAAPAGLGRTSPVGAYSPQGDSPYGLADMAGNVWEWTRTLWGREVAIPEYRYPYRADDGRERSDVPAGPYREVRVARGGSYRDLPARVTCAARARAAADARHPARGFRVALEVGTR